MRKTILIFRKAFPGSRSIENLFYPIAEHLAQKGVPVQTAELPYYSKGFWARFKNALSLLHFRGIVHVTGDVYYSILGAWFSKRVVTYHDLSFLDRSSGVKRKILMLFWLTLPVRFAHQLTAVSEATKQAILKETQVDPKKITVIPNFIDPIFKVRSNYVFDTAKPRILLIGTDFNKNLENTIPALGGLHIAVTIIGQLDKVQTQLLEKYQIHYQNKVGLSLAELYQTYTATDILLFCSAVEGFGLPILEAQATGIPVITSNLSSMPEVAGDGAILVDPFSQHAISNAIQQVINDEQLRKDLIEKGLENSKRFSFEQIVGQYFGVYQNLHT